tara:strand:- start:847 stop:1572 length:726 start_codon:yes stop_codon:yes gene_type:complete
MGELYLTGEYFVHLAPRASVGGTDYWSNAADPDGKIRDRLLERSRYLSSISAEIKYIAKLEPGAVLDIGCGPGWLLSQLDSRWERYGIEPSKQAASVAEKYASIFEGTLEDFVFRKNAFDLVVAYHVIEHIRDPLAAIKSIHQLLRPGGTLIVGTPDFDSGCARRFGSKFRLLHDATHISLFSNDSMHRFLRNHGFKITSVDYPYFETPWFTRTNLLRLLNKKTTSPPFYGNFMTFYCSKV